MAIILLNQKYNALMEKNPELGRTYANESGRLMLEAQLLAHPKNPDNCFNPTAAKDTVETIESRIIAPVWDGKPDWVGTESYAMLRNNLPISKENPPIAGICCYCVLPEEAAFGYRLFSVEKNSGNALAMFGAVLKSLQEKGINHLYQRTYCQGDDKSSNPLISKYMELGFRELTRSEANKYDRLFNNVPYLPNVEKNRIRLVMNIKSL
jgi:hypothetical protein